MKFNSKQRLFGVLLTTILLIGSGLVVVDANSLNHKQKMTIEENLEEWFGGEKLHKYVANNRKYDWYIDQRDTGEYSNANCGPASATMAMRWKHKEFEGTAEEARTMYPAYGAWWRTNIIFRYFEAYDLDYYTMMFEEDKEQAIGDLKAKIDQGQIAILCIDMDYITREDDLSRRINRFYDYADGHFLVVKGYAEVDESIYFEVYDPNSWGMAYTDGELMGKDRFYLADELVEAARNWYQFAIIID